MRYQSIARRLRRQAMRENNATFRERVNDAIRQGKPVRNVTFNAKPKEAASARPL